jgi:enamine deaminase RidA (YjgF/YER057c/UK114 family)
VTHEPAAASSNSSTAVVCRSPDRMKASYQCTKGHNGTAARRTISSYLERRRKGPIYPVVVANGFVYPSSLPPFDPATGDVKPAPFERQAELVLDQMKLCLEAAGSSLAQVVKCSVYCSPDPSHFGKFNELRALFSDRVARPHLSARAIMARAVRCRGRLRGGSLVNDAAIRCAAGAQGAFIPRTPARSRNTAAAIARTSSGGRRLS